MALLVLLPTSTRTRIVTSNLCRTCWPCCWRYRRASSAARPCSVSSGSTFACVAFGTFFGGVTFGLAAGFGDLVNVGAHVAGSFALWLGALNSDGEVVA